MGASNATAAGNAAALNQGNSNSNGTLSVKIAGSVESTASIVLQTNMKDSDGTNVFAGQKNASNALGYVGPSDYSITSFPFKIKRCDQVVLLPVKRMTDFNDYCKTSEAFFTMSVYMVNLFESKDSNKLLESITLDKLTNVPTQIVGAPNCLDFKGTNGKRMGICFSNEVEVKNIIYGFKDFMKCRLGDNLKDLSMDDMDRVLKLSCMGRKLPKFTRKMLDAGLFPSDDKNSGNEKLVKLFILFYLA
jgi:hypothetical protein